MFSFEKGPCLVDLSGQVQPQKVGLGEEPEVALLHEDLRVGHVGEGRVDRHGEAGVRLGDREPRRDHVGRGFGSGSFFLIGTEFL